MREALLIVDVQHDFLPGGALAVPDGDAVLAPIAELAGSGRFDLVVATRDWHPPDHGSFADAGGPWPPHCVRDTHGAQLHAHVEPLADAVVDKGREPGAEGYSAFENPALRALLRDHGVEAVTVVGLATDYCVRHTARDAVRHGFRVTIATGAVRGIDPEHAAAALHELQELGAEIA
jgi:nicotinamidase-related amidase